MCTSQFKECSEQTALERQTLPCTYPAVHELERSQKILAISLQVNDCCTDLNASQHVNHIIAVIAVTGNMYCLDLLHHLLNYLRISQLRQLSRAYSDQACGR